MLNEKQRLLYLESWGACCPVCDSTSVERPEDGPFECDSQIAWQKAWCVDCGESWVETYSLCDVQTGLDDPDSGTEPDMATALELRNVLEWIVAQENQTFVAWESHSSSAECSVAEEIMRRCKTVLAQGFTPVAEKGDEHGSD